MKNKLLLFVVALTAMLLASCGSSLDYEKYIPKEAAVVGRFNLKDIADKGDFGDNKDLTAILKKSLQETSLSSKGRVVVEKIIEDPKIMGIDLREPVYYYTTQEDNETYFGVIATMLNRDDFKNFLLFVSKEGGGSEEISEHKGVSYVTDDEFVIAFNDEWVIAKTFSGDVEDVIDDLIARADFKSEQTIGSDAAYKRMIDNDGMAQLVVRGGILAKIMSQTNNRFDIAEAYKDMANYDFIFDLDAEKGKLTLAGEIYASTDEGRRKLTETMKMFDEISGTYSDYIDKDALFSAVCNVKGKKYMQFLEKLGMKAKEANEMRPYVEGINGDIAFSLNTVKANLKGLDMRMFAHINNAEPYLQLRNTLKYLPDLNEFTTNEFSLSLASYLPTSELATEMGLADEAADPNPGNIVAYFGVHDKNSLYTSFSISSHAFDKVPNPLDKDLYNGRTAYVRFNSAGALDIVKLIAKNNGDDNSTDYRIGMHVLGLIDYMDLYSTTDNHALLSVVMKDKDKNALSTLVGELTNIISILN